MMVGSNNNKVSFDSLPHRVPSLHCHAKTRQVHRTTHQLVCPLQQKKNQGEWSSIKELDLI